MNYENREEVLVAVGYNGYSLRFALEELRNDKEVVKIAVGNNEYILKYASEELRNDEFFWERYWMNMRIYMMSF